MLIKAGLDDNASFRIQIVSRLPGYNPVGVETIGASVESRARIVKPYFRRQSCNIGGPDIRRIGNNHIEDTLDILEPVAPYRPEAIVKAKRARVGRGRFQGRAGNVRRHDMGRPDVGHQRQANRASSGSEIEDAAMPFALDSRQDTSKSRLDQGLGIRSRFERCLRQ